MRAHISGMRSAVLATVATATLGLFAIGPAAAATGPSGSAEAVNTLASLTYGSTTVKAGVDRALSTWGASPSAEAAMDFLVSGTTKLGGGKWTASTPAESGSETLGTGAKTIDGAASATVTGASVEALINAASASSSAVVTMADLNLLGGLVTAATAQTTTSSLVSTTASQVDRTLQLGDVQVLSIRALLERLGVEPASLTCAGVAAAGAELGVDTAQACPSQAAALAAIGAVQTELDDARTQLLADLQTAQSTVAGLTVITQPLIDLASSYGFDWSGLLGLLLGSGPRDALIAEIDARLTAVDSGASTAAAGTCAAATTAVAGVVASVPSMDATLTPLGTAVGDACALLESLLDDLMNVSLLGLDAVTVGLSAFATPDAPLAGGTGTIGAVTVGNRSIAVAGLTSLGAALQQAIATAEAETSDALTALGLGAFPAPEIEILGVESSAGRDQDETWFAHVTVTGLHVSIPPVPISLPSGTSLGDVLGTPAAPARAALSAAAPVATSPQIVVNAAVFSGDARYRAAGPINPSGGGGGTGGNSGGTPLPATGAGVHWLAAGMLLTVAGAMIRFTAGAR